MRLKNLLFGDIRFQFKYGFYFLYAVLTLLYTCLLAALPAAWRPRAAALLIYSDPAAMGLFFMGAIVLLEKSQRVLSSLAVSPVKISEYILSKVLSIGILSAVVALFLCLAAGGKQLAPAAAVTLLCSALFSLAGMVLASRADSLNQFFAMTIPVELLFSIPLVPYLLGVRSQLLDLFPSNFCMSVLDGSCSNPLAGSLVLTACCALCFFAAHRSVASMLRKAGGAEK